MKLDVASEPCPKLGPLSAALQELRASDSGQVTQERAAQEFDFDGLGCLGATVLL